MKRSNKYIKTWSKSVIFAPLITALILFFSCSKNDQVGDVGGPAAVSVQLKGTVSGLSKANKGSRDNGGLRAAVNRNSTGQLQSKVSLGNGLTLVATAIPVASSSYEDKMYSTEKSLRAASTPQQGSLASDVEYEVLAYDGAGNLAGRQVYQVGNSLTEVPFKDANLLVGSTYTFVSYSNGTNTLPALTNAETLDGATLALSLDNQYLYWKTEGLTLSGGDNLLGIELAHQFSQINSIQFAIADGVLEGQNFVELEGLGVTTSTGITADLSGSIAYGSTIDTIGIPVTGTVGARVFTNTLTTPVIVAVEPIADVTNTSLEIGTIAIGGILKNDLSVDFNFEAGTHYNIELTIASFTDDGVDINGLIWARGNLWYDANDVDQPYKIRQDASAAPVNAQDFWRFGTTTPGGSDHNPNFDPCAEVLPTNTWRMPSRSEFQALGAPTAQISARYYGTLNPILNVLSNIEVQLFGTWNNADAEDRPLLLNIDGRLSANGVNRRASQEGRGNYSVLAGVGGVRLGVDLTGVGQYWTNDNRTTSPNYVRFDYSQFSLVDINLFDLNLIKIGILSNNNLGRTFTHDFSTPRSGLNGGTALNAEGDIQPVFGSWTAVPAWQNRLMIRCVRPVSGS